MTRDEAVKERPVVFKKSDEAEPRYGLGRKSFTRIYGRLGSPGEMFRYRMAGRFYEVHREAIHRSLKESGLDEGIPWLGREEPFFERRKRSILGRIMSYRVHSLNRRSTSGYYKVMFHLFRLSGCAIADMKQPSAKLGNPGKRRPLF